MKQHPSISLNTRVRIQVRLVGGGDPCAALRHHFLILPVLLPRLMHKLLLLTIPASYWYNLIAKRKSFMSYGLLLFESCFGQPLTHFIPSPQPTRATALPGCLPILASQKPAEIGSSPITVFHLPLLCDFSVLFTKTYYDCYHIYIKGKLTE